MRKIDPQRHEPTKTREPRDRLMRALDLTRFSRLGLKSIKIEVHLFMMIFERHLGN